jgi:hypothetical protein
MPSGRRPWRAHSLSGSASTPPCSAAEPALSQQRGEHRGDGQRGEPGRHHHGDGGEVDIGEHLAQVREGTDRQARAGRDRRDAEAGGRIEPEEDGVLAALEIFEQSAVALREGGAGGLLADQPGLLTRAEGRAAAHEGREARRACLPGGRRRRGPRVKRLQIDAFGRLGDQFLLKRGAIERLFGRGAPSCVVRRGELGKQAFFQGAVHGFQTVSSTIAS